LSKKSAAEPPGTRGPRAAGRGCPPACIHVDLDGYAEIAGAWGWDVPEGPDSVFETGLRAALDMFAENGIRATLFAVSRSLDDPRKRALIEEAVAAGHEIASHTATHPDLRLLGRDEKRRELRESRERLSSELGVPVDGFRAPGYRIDRESIELLAEAGYAWDSSAFPTARFADHLEVPVESLTRPTLEFAGLPIAELPLPDHRPAPMPFNPSYSILIGMPYLRWGVRRAARRGLPLVLLFHLIDFARPLGRDTVSGLSQRVLTLSTHSQARKLRRCQAVLDALDRRFDVVHTTSFLQRIG
jgi:hypothetical protein